MTSFVVMRVSILVVSVWMAAATIDINAHLSKRAQTSRIAFSVGMTSDQDLHQNASIIFNKVFTNTGNGYSNTTGMFTCPVAGAYVFQFHALTAQDGQMWLELYKNTQYMISAYSHSTNDFGAASNAIVLTLKVNDVVHIQAQGDVSLYGASDEIYCTFNGFLLFNAHGHN